MAKAAVAAEPPRRSGPPARQGGAQAGGFPLRAAIALALATLAIAVFAEVRHFGFLSWDDPSYVTENPHVLRGLTWRGVWWAFTTGDAANWHPLTWLSHMLDVQLFGVNGGRHHLTSLVLHVANVLLLFGALCQLFTRRRKDAKQISNFDLRTSNFDADTVWQCGLVAALFAVHPLHVESVAWISERKDVLSAFFGLSAIWSYATYAQRPSGRRYAVTLGLFALGLMAKPMLVTLPLVLLLLDVWPLDRLSRGGARALIVEKLPFFALAAASSVVTFIVQQRGGAVGGLGALGWDLRGENALLSYVRYLGKCVWPSGLSAFYPYPPKTSAALAVLALAGLAGLTILAARAWRRHPYLLVGWLWFVIMLLPVIGLVQVGDQAMADRYTYLPLIGLFIAAAWGAQALAARWRVPRTARAFVAAAIVMGCAMMARTQVSTWAANESLWGHALAVTPDNYRAHVGLADAAMDAGRPADAVVQYQAAARLVPRAAAVQNSLGLALTAAGRLDDAAAAYAAAVALDPGFADAHDNLGAMLARLGRLDEAIAHYRVAIRIDPSLALAHNNLGLALATRGQVDEGIGECLSALSLKPDDAQWHFQVAAMLETRGRKAEAIDHLRRTLALDPAHTAARQALARLGRQ
jgi:tetratricopeptide (TPR) repeat protein